ncbi:MAG: RadC family protein [Culicoidibacterales bacterium]
MLKPSLLLPREKMKLHGVQTLQFYELIAVIIGSGNKKKDVLTISREITALFLQVGNREQLQFQMQNVDGIGTVNQMKLLALYEMMTTWATIKQASDIAEIVLVTPEDAVKYFRSIFTWSQEMLIALYLDAKNSVLSCEKLFLGTIDSVEVHPREIFSHALFKSAKSIIIMHNHPSGNPMPSNADIKTTKSLAEIGRTLGIPIIDHIIITKTKFTSLKRESYF